MHYALFLKKPMEYIRASFVVTTKEYTEVEGTCVPSAGVRKEAYEE